MDCTFVATTMIGNPRLFERIVSPRGSMTSSSSFDVAAVVWPRDLLDSSSPSSGSLYSLNLFTTD